MSDLEKKWDEKGYKYIKMNFESSQDFYNALYGISQFNSENIKAYGTSRDEQYEIVLNEDSDMDDQSKPSTIALQKKKKKNNTEEESDSWWMWGKQSNFLVSLTLFGLRGYP